MKVFISSTFTDLADHRRAAHDALEQLGLHVIWMESFGAKPGSSSTACLGEIEDCELFVGIYAHRYGHIPDGADISITEQEFLHAQAKGKPIFGFVINEMYPWPPNHVEHDKKLQLSAFISKVKKQPVEFFTTPDNLAHNIASSVGQYLLKNTPVSRAHNTPVERHQPRGSTLPNQPYFFGRERELSEIADAIAPESRTWGVLIDGPGGIGKTALAIHAAHLAPKAFFDRKIFITAKIRELTVDGEKPLADFTRPNYLEILNELALELGEDGIPKMQPAERTNALRLALASRKTLIILDNLETLDDSERTRLYQFLSRLPEGNKAIVTSRKRDRDSVAAHPIRLDRMDLEESLQLISELAKNNNALRKTTTSQRTALYEATNGNPLLITWICGQLGNKESYLDTIEHASAFIEKAPEGNNPLEYIFGDLLETFTNSETKVLASLTYFSVPVQLKWIAEMTGLTKQATQTALEDLANRSILIADQDAQKFYLPPLAAQFIKTRRPKAVAQTGDKLVDRAFALIKQFGGENNYNGFKTLEAEWPTVAAALPRLYSRRNDQLQSVCESIVTFLEFSGKWDESLELTQLAEQKALSAKDLNHAGWRASDTASIYYYRNQTAELISCIDRIEKYWKKSGSEQKAMLHRMRGFCFELEKKYDEARSAYSKAIRIWKGNPSGLGSAGAVYLDLGYAQQKVGDLAASTTSFRKALQIGRKIKDLDLISSALGCLANLAQEKREWANALTHAQEALALNEKIRNLRGIATNCSRIASVLLKQNKKSEAKPYAIRSADIFTQLGLKNELAEVQQVLKDCE